MQDRAELALGHLRTAAAPRRPTRCQAPQGSRRAAERPETIAGVRKDKQRHVVVDCAPDEPREATKLYAFVQRAST